MKTHTKTLLTALTAATLFTATHANGAIVFAEDFEGYGNTDDNTLASYDPQPPVPTGWISASTGHRSSEHGLNLVGTNTVYSFRYTNSGLTTADGVIGNLTAGETYTISFDVSLDTGGITHDDYDVYFGTFDDLTSRNDVAGGATSSFSNLLATVKGGWDDTDGVWTSDNGTVSGSTITFTYTSDGTETTLGQDLVVRLDGATNSANIDNVSVDIVPEPGSLALLGLGGLLIASRRRRD